MCRYPALSAAATAAAVSSGGLWKTPRPRAGISTSLLSFRAGGVAGVILGSSRSVMSVCAPGAPRRPGVLGLAGLAAREPLGRVRCGRPAGQQVKRLLGRRADLGGVERQAQPLVGVEGERLVTELQLADDRVMQALAARPVEAHVVRRPTDAELVAARRELADEVLKVAVVGVAAGLWAQRRHEVRGQPLPVGVEVARRRVQEGEPRAVGGLLG